MTGKVNNEFKGYSRESFLQAGVSPIKNDKGITNPISQ